MRGNTKGQTAKAVSTVRDLRRYCRFIVLLLPLACGGGATGSGCTSTCGGESLYPLDIAGAEPTNKVMRARITQAGLDNISASVAGIIAAGCDEPGTTDANCVNDPEEPLGLEFFVGKPCEPTNFSIDLLVSDLEVEARAGTCVSPAGEVLSDHHRSSFFIDQDSLDGNVQLNLIEDAVGGGIEMVLGCAAENFDNCQDSEFIKIWPNLVVATDESACTVSSGGGTGIEIQSLKMMLRPRVEPDENGRSRLVLTRDDVRAEDVNLSLDVDISRAAADDNCQESDTDCSVVCGTWNAASAVATFFLEREFIASWLSNVVVDAALGQFANEPLDMSGEINLKAVVGAGDAEGEGVAFIARASTETAEVTGDAGARGLNFGMDMGFYAPHSPCVPLLPEGLWTLPPPPDPGVAVLAPNPDTGVLEWEPFDLVIRCLTARPTRFLMAAVCVCRYVPRRLQKPPLAVSFRPWDFSL